MFLLFFSCILLKTASAYVINEEECLNYTVYPVQYDLTIIPHVLKHGTSYYDCYLIITIITNVPNVNMIELDAKDLEIHRESVKVMFRDIDIINSVRPYEYDRRQGKMYLYLKEDLEPYSVRRTQYYIKIFFRKFLTNEDDGIFIAKYFENGQEKSMLGTRLSPNKAKYFFPCFDNPQFEAGFKFKVILPSDGDQSISTSLLVAEELHRITQKDNQLIIQYIPSPQIAVYQVGLHNSDFSNRIVTTRKTNDTLVLWAPASTLPRYTYILKFGQSIVDCIHEYSGINRPLVLGPINVVAVPKSLDNYEIGSWNLLTIGEHKLANIPKYTSIKQKEEMSHLLSEQLCRIWLGNPGETERTRWKEEWFKEGMATYLGYYFLSQVGTFWDTSSYSLQTRNRAMEMDWRPETPNLESFNRTLAINIPSRYQNLVRYKTAALLWMVENWLGSERFHGALVKYINTRRGSFVSVDDFLVFLQAETVECEFFKGYTAAHVLNSWFRQPGYPLVKVTVYRNQDTQDVVYLEQKQFTFSNSTRRHHKYLIPVSYITQHTGRCYNCFQPKFTVDDTSYTFKENLNNGWIILNRNASGYYRVNYDIETWKMIIKTLKSPTERHSINPLNRAQIINDAFALYMSGDINFKLASEIVSCLEHEDNYVVWDAAFSGFQFLKLDGANTKMTKQLYNNWKYQMRECVSLTYRRAWWRPAAATTRTDAARKFRAEVTSWACTLGLEPCLADLRAACPLLHRDLYDPDLRETCYYTLLNDSAEYDSIKITNGFEKEDFTSAERMSKEELRFLYRLPIDRPKPLPLLESATSVTRIPATQPTRKVHYTKKSSSGNNHSASVILGVVYLILFVIVR